MKQKTKELVLVGIGILFILAVCLSSCDNTANIAVQEQDFPTRIGSGIR